MANDVVMEGQITDIRWGSFVLLGLVAIIFGLVIAMFPGLSATVLIELIGIFIILLSFGVIMLSAVAPGGLKGSILLAVLGIIGFFFGIATILSPHVMGKVIFILVGIALFIGGLIGLILAISEKNMTHRGLFAIQAFLSLIIGIIIIVGPVIGVALAVIFIGVYFVVWGILSVIMGALIRAAKKA
jgi:uncharacterized membrane protein HdeD (DUF308 family)